MDVPSEPLGIYLIIAETLSSVGTALGIQKGKQLEASPFGDVVCDTTTFLSIKEILISKKDLDARLLRHDLLSQAQFQKQQIKETTSSPSKLFQVLLNIKWREPDMDVGVDFVGHGRSRTSIASRHSGILPIRCTIRGVSHLFNKI